MAEVVAIGCKLPNGIRMKVKDTVVVLKGRATYRIPSDGRKFVPPEIIEGDSVTFVDKAFAEAWFKEHKDRDYVKKGFVYMAPNRNEMKAQAKDTAELKTGLEPIEPKKHGVAALNDDDRPRV